MPLSSSIINCFFWVDIRTITGLVLDLITENDEETPVVFCQLDTLTKKDEEVIWMESAR